MVTNMAPVGRGIWNLVGQTLYIKGSAFCCWQHWVETEREGTLKYELHYSINMMKTLHIELYVIFLAIAALSETENMSVSCYVTNAMTRGGSATEKSAVRYFSHVVWLR